MVGEVEGEVRMLRREVCHLDCIDVLFLTRPFELLSLGRPIVAMESRWVWLENRGGNGVVRLELADERVGSDREKTRGVFCRVSQLQGELPRRPKLFAMCDLRTGQRDNEASQRRIE